MSAAHSDSQEEVQEGHDTPIKTPQQLLTVIVLAFVVPVLVIVLLVKNVTWSAKPAAGTAALDAEAVAARIQPVGRVVLKLEGATALRGGEEVYKAQCSACHASGAAGAPKYGDAAAWGPRVASGYEALLTSALKGKGAMAAQGGGDFNDVEIGRAVVYMANAGGAKFEEPKAAAPAASAASQ